MCIIKRAASRWLQLAVGIFLVVSICVFVGVGIMIQYQDLAETYKMAEETTAFVQAECEKFDNYTRGSSARALQDLLDKADGLKKFISPQQLTAPAFLKEFIYTEHVGGIVILDQDLQPIAQADMDHQNTLSLWTETTVKKNMQDILAHPEKTYVDHMTLNDVPYDMAATATDDGSCLILCYASTEKPASDPYELNIRSILTNNSFDKNPTLVITDGTQVLSTNSSIVAELGTAQYHQLASTVQWKDGAFTKFDYQHTTYYGLRRVYGSYYVYAVYAAEDVFTHRTAFLAFGFMAYLGVGIIILAIQRHMSATIQMVVIAAAVLFAGGISVWWFIVGGAGVGAALIAIVKGTDYMTTRIANWKDPWLDAQDKGLQAVQSLMAIGSGGVFGLGLGNGRQKFLYLPEPQNDFIFAVVCEELGLVGACLVLLLFALLIIRGYWLALNARDRFGSLVIVGITTLFAFQVFANVAVVTNLFPVTGISLPFFSYGGSALIIQLAEMGLILSISRQNPAS